MHTHFDLETVLNETYVSGHDLLVVRLIASAAITAHHAGVYDVPSDDWLCTPDVQGEVGDHLEELILGCEPAALYLARELASVALAIADATGEDAARLVWA